MTERPSGYVAFAGSVRGREHARALRNNQDAVATYREGDTAVAVVCDGCSSSPYSEVGARVAAIWLARFVPRYARADGDARAWIDDTCTALLGVLGKLARGLAPREDEIRARVHDLLLFSFLVAVVRGERAVIFGAGDGVLAVNGDVTTLDAGDRNAPSYIAYALGSAEACAVPPRASHARLHFEGDSRAIDSLVVATDGAIELARARETDSMLALAHDPRLAKNPSLLQKRLVVLSERDRMLFDDTSIAVVRRAEAF